MQQQNAMSAYSNTQAHASVMDASPHKLIALLLDGALTRLNAVNGAIERKDFARKGELIGKVIDILSNLQADLNLEKGGEVAANLDALYDYMVRRLLVANKDNDTAIVKEVGDLLGEVRAGWVGIPEGSGA